jgi:hypothetical protein
VTSFGAFVLAWKNEAYMDPGMGKLRLRRPLSTSGVTLSQWSGRYSALPLTNSQYRDRREDMDGQPTNPGPHFVSDNQTDPGSTGAEGRIRWQTQLRDQMDDRGTGDPNTQQSSPRRQLPASTDRAPKSRHPPGLDTPPKGDDIASAAGADKPAEDVPHGCSVRRLSSLNRTLVVLEVVRVGRVRLDVLI